MRASWESVIEKVLAHQNAEELMALFQLLLTEEERSAIAGRLKVFQLLLTGDLSQRQIAAEYRVSIATITRCSNYLKHMPPEQRQSIKTLILSAK
jgi:TrpR family transcriptional regulator, trp operon repressor